MTKQNLIKINYWEKLIEHMEVMWAPASTPTTCQACIK